MKSQIVKIVLAVVAVVLGLGLNALGENTAIAPLHVEGSLETRSAYISRAKVVEDRPSAIQDVSIDSEIGPFGRLGLAEWSYSSLCNRSQEIHRRAFSEFDLGVYWNYDWNFADDWKICNRVYHWWIVLEGYRHDEVDYSTYEWWYTGSIDNPYLVPSLLMRRGWNNENWAYFKVGLSKPLTFETLSPQLTFTPGIFCDLGNKPLFEARYGDDGCGAMAALAQFSITYTPHSAFSFYAILQQYGLTDHNLRQRAGGMNHRDITILTIGANVRF